MVEITINSDQRTPGDNSNKDQDNSPNLYGRNNDKFSSKHSDRNPPGDNRKRRAIVQMSIVEIMLTSHCSNSDKNK